MPSFPVMLNVRDRRCVIIGGGPVALRRAGSLVEAGAKISLIAPTIDPHITALPIQTHQRPYQPDDLDGAWLVVIASDSPQVNQQVARDARDRGVLANRADEPGSGDFAVPAHAHHGPVTLAVHTDGVSASAAAAIRRQFSDTLDRDWPRLLTLAAPYRASIQQRFDDPDQRRERLMKLADPDAMAILKEQGEQALLEHYRHLAEPDTPIPPTPDARQHDRS
jgi:precorrin-2 dehydrogenase